MLIIYRFITFFFFFLFIITIFLRKILNKEDKSRYKEKIFSKYFFPRKQKKKKLIWFHAASIGEVQSIFPIISKLKKNNKNFEFLITTVTLSAGRLVHKKYINTFDVNHRYFPIDVRFLVKIFLDEWRPFLILFVDSEIWPNLISEIKARNISSVLINGRITKKSFKRWIIVSSLAKEIFNTFDLCLSSSKESMKYLRQLSVRNLKYIGNIKLASQLAEEPGDKKNKNIFNKKKVWCAASTHEGEEIFCLKTHVNIKKIYKNLITIIIPRHINRSNEINLLCKKFDLNSQILNNNQSIDKRKEIIIINSFGSLPRYFKYSKSVFIGKSTLKKLDQVGGQNPIEAAKLGCKIYHGPYVYNFKEIYELFKSYKIAEQIKDEKDFYNKLIEDLKKPKIKNNKINKIIDRLGKKILNDSVKEINKLLI